MSEATKRRDDIMLDRNNFALSTMESDKTRLYDAEIFERVLSCGLLYTESPLIKS